MSGGDETIGPLKEGLLAKETASSPGARVSVDAAGQDRLRHPKHRRQAGPPLLGPPLRRRDDVVVNGTTRVKGDHRHSSATGSGRAPVRLSRRVSSLGIVQPGHNEIAIGQGNRHRHRRRHPQRRRIVVIGQDVATAPSRCATGSTSPSGGSCRRSIKPCGKVRVHAGRGARGQLVLVVGGHKSLDRARCAPAPSDRRRPGTPPGHRQPPEGTDRNAGTSCCPSRSPRIRVRRGAALQRYAHGSKLSPSSFFWLFGSLKVISKSEPRNHVLRNRLLRHGGTRTRMAGKSPAWRSR